MAAGDTASISVINVNLAPSEELIFKSSPIESLSASVMEKS